MATKLIIYKRWLKAIHKKNGKDNIDNTIQIDVKKNIDDKLHKKILIEAIQNINHKKMTMQIRQSLPNMVNNNMGNISEIDTFLNVESKKACAALFKERAKVKPLWGLMSN